jgi:hypothetical protein
MVYTNQPRSRGVKNRELKYIVDGGFKYTDKQQHLIDNKNGTAWTKKPDRVLVNIDRQQQSLLKVDAKREFIKADRSPIRTESHISRNMSCSSSGDLEITIDRINQLLEDDEEDEYGEIIIPTEYAIKIAIELVSKAANLIPKRFFKAWVSTEDSGGVGLDWSKPELEKEVRLVIPATPDRKICLYHEMGNEYGVEYNVSAKTLSYWLNWCNPK